MSIRGVEVRLDWSCIGTYMAFYFLGRKEIPYCSYSFIEGVVAGVIGTFFQTNYMIRLSDSYSKCSWLNRRRKRRIGRSIR